MIRHQINNPVLQRFQFVVGVTLHTACICIKFCHRISELGIKILFPGGSLRTGFIRLPVFFVYRIRQPDPFACQEIKFGTGIRR